MGPQVNTKVGLAHGSDGMAAHGVAIDALHSAVWRGDEEVAECDIPAKMWGADDDGNEARVEDFPAQLDRATDAAVAGRTVKRRAKLVMSDGSVEAFECGENGWKVAGHPLRGAGAAVSGDPDSLCLRECRQMWRSWRGEVQDGRDTVRGKLFENIRGAGEIVAVEGVEERHGSGAEEFERGLQLWVGVGVSDERNVLHCCLPCLLQTANTSGDTHGMAENAAATRIDEVGCAEGFEGVGRLTCGLA